MQLRETPWFVVGTSPAEGAAMKTSFEASSSSLLAATETRDPRTARTGASLPSRVAGVAIIGVFATLSIASGGSKEGDKKGEATPSGSAATDPSKAKLLGSCDRSDQFYKSCSETYEGGSHTTVADERSSCKTLGGKFREAPCPRIGAVVQCFEGNAPYLTGNYAYEGAKNLPDHCPRGKKDLAKTPELKANPSPASCNAVANGGTCLQFPVVTAENERHCLDSGGSLKQPAEPCPAENAMLGIQLKGKDGDPGFTEYYYSSPAKDSDGKPHTWTREDALLICALAGDNCTQLPPPSKAAAAAPADSAPAGKAAGAAVKPSAPAKPATPAKPSAAPTAAPAKSAAKK